jgi:hypothetical protein
VASNLSDIEKHQRKKNRGDYNEEGGSESDSTVKNGTTSNPSRNNNKRNRNTVGGVKVSNSLDNYWFVKEPRALKTSNSNEESSGPNMSLVAYDREMVNPNPSGVAACDSWTGVLASNTLDDTRWVGLSTLHRRGDSLGESTQGVVPPHGRESQEEIDDIIASADWDADHNDNILDLWDVDVLNINTRAGLSHLHMHATRFSSWMLQRAQMPAGNHRISLRP